MGLSTPVAGCISRMMRYNNVLKLIYRKWLVDGRDLLTTKEMVELRRVSPMYPARLEAGSSPKMPDVNGDSRFQSVAMCSRLVKGGRCLNRAWSVLTLRREKECGIFHSSVQLIGQV